MVNGLRFYISLFLISALTIANVFASEEKESCTEVLDKARDLYDDGKLLQVPTYLQACLQDGFTKPQKLEAYRLVILSYIFNDDPEKADEAMLALLNTDPEYRPDEKVDPIEYVTLFNTFRTKPTISYGIVAGPNYSGLRVMNRFTTNSETDNAFKTKAKWGGQIGVHADWFLSESFFLSSELTLSYVAFSLSEKLMDYTTLTYDENQIRLGLPLYVKYEKMIGNKWKPFIGIGGGAELMLSSSALITRINDQGDNDASGPTLNRMNGRNPFQTFLGAQVGAKYKLGYGFIYADLRYQYGLSNLTKTDNRWSEEELLYYYGYVDSDVSLAGIQFQVGYLKNIYNPKKKK
jgi:hypothetical protein